ncbi:hypothetical protein N7488_011340 [Penicillium malachiteum]|nr:hypothetical protein N7488_011340 [Penicillium malachiteum]
MARNILERLKNRFFLREPSDQDDHSDKDDLRNQRTRQGTQSVEDSSIDHRASTSVTKPDLWQRAFDKLEPQKQQLIQSILIPESTDSIDSSDANIDPSVVNRLKALNGVIETVKTQYQIDQQKSKIKEPTQKIIKSVLSFQDLIQAAMAFDPTGHATSVWAIVSLGLTMTQNYRSQKEAWLDSSTILADILTRYSFMEGEYQKDPNTDQHVETALVKVYVAVLTFAAQVQSLHNRSRTVLVWKSIPGNILSDLQNSIDEAESHLGQWLTIADRREQRGRGEQLLQKAKDILTNIDKVMDSLNKLNDKMVLTELKIAEEASYNANTGEEYQECLPKTRQKLLEEIKDWATDQDKTVFWLQGMAGTGKSTISRTVARWLDEEGLLGGSFFFKKGGTDREDAKRLFTTLTKQILKRLPQLQEPVKTAIEEACGIGSSNPQEQFDELLFKPLKNLDLGLKSPLILVVVIDALDECQVPADVAAFCKTLPKLNDLRYIRLRFFITSRPEPPIIKGFQPIDNDEVILHEIESSIIKDDLGVFLRERLGRIRDGYRLAESWPGEEITSILVNMAVPLFIYAATIYRFLNCEDEPPNDRLQAILSSRSTEGKDVIDNEYSKLTGIYLPVLNHVISQKGPKESISWMNDFRRIVGAIALLFSPLSAISLAGLLRLDEIKVCSRLNTLRSVVSVPKHSDAPVQLLHLSFREFLVDDSASADFCINEQAGHTQLAKDCIKYMKCIERGLKRDICDLSDSGTRRLGIDNNTLQNHVPPELRYACRYWISHLDKGDQSDTDWKLIEEFLKLHFLHWLEVMSLFGWVSETIGQITVLQSLAEKSLQLASPQLAAFLQDAKRFILKNRQIADEAPLQVYYSGLVFAPQKSIIRREFQSEFPTWISQLPKVEENWGAELQTLEGHSSWVRSVAFSSDGRLLASGSYDNTVRLWDPVTGDLRRTLEGHSSAVNSVAFSSDGRLLASSSDDNTVRLWDPVTGDLRRTLEGHSSAVRSVAFSSNGRLLTSGSEDNTVRLWDPVTGDLRWTLEGHSSWVRLVAFSSDGRLLASGSYDNTVRLWDPVTGDLWRTLEGHSSAVNSVAFSSDGRLLASGSYDNTVRLWDPVTGDLRRTLEGHLSWVRSVAFSSNGRLLASGSNDNTVRLWDPVTGDLRRTLEGHSSAVNSVAFSSDGRLLASGSDDNTVRLWDPVTGDLRRTLEGHSSWVRLVAFSSDGRLLASGSYDNTVRLWDPVTGDLRRTLEGHLSWVRSVAFSSDGRLLASGSEDNTVRLWDPVTGDLRRTLEGHSSAVNSVAFSSDGRLLASGSYDNTVRLWDPVTGDLQRTLETPATVYNLEFSQDGSYVTTNLGILIVRPGHGNEVSHSTCTHLPIFIAQEHWIKQDRKDVLWLPPHFRPRCSAANRNLLGLGHASGRVTFLQFCLQ